MSRIYSLFDPTKNITKSSQKLYKKPKFVFRVPRYNMGSDETCVAHQDSGWRWHLVIYIFRKYILAPILWKKIQTFGPVCKAFSHAKDTFIAHSEQYVVKCQIGKRKHLLPCPICILIPFCKYSTLHSTHWGRTFSETVLDLFLSICDFAIFFKEN